MSVNFDLTGKTAVITGGAGILCSVMAKELAKKGVRVAILGHSGDKAQAIADEIKNDGGRAIACNADVLSLDSLKKAREYVVDKALKWVFDLNMMGAVLTTQVFGELFLETGKGCVINISSMAAYHPLTKTIAYSGAKAAVANFTQWMAVHFNQNYSKNIRVNAVAPGFLLTNQNRFLMTDEDGNPTERGRKVLDKTPMGRYGEPEEIAGSVLWLCSDAASFVNGAIIPVDGGFSAYWGV